MFNRDRRMGWNSSLAEIWAFWNEVSWLLLAWHVPSSGVPGALAQACVSVDRELLKGRVNT